MIPPREGALASWRGTHGTVASLLWCSAEPRGGMPDLASLTLMRVDQTMQMRGLMPSSTSEAVLFGVPGVKRKYTGGSLPDSMLGLAVVVDAPFGALVLISSGRGDYAPLDNLVSKLANISLPQLAGLTSADPTASGERVVGIRDGQKLVLAVLDRDNRPVVWRGIPIQVRQLRSGDRPIGPGSGITNVTDSRRISTFGGGIDPISGANRLEVEGPSGNLLSGEIIEPPASLVPMDRPTRLAPPDRRPTENNGS